MGSFLFCFTLYKMINNMLVRLVDAMDCSSIVLLPFNATNVDNCKLPSYFTGNDGKVLYPGMSKII